MKTIVKEITTSILATLLFAVVLCGIYPVIIWGASQLLFPHQANGSLIESSDRKIVGSELLGQNFTGAKYFHPATVGRGREWLRCRQLERLESRTDFAKS